MLQEVGVLSYSGYSLSKSHSMTMRYNPDSGAASRTVEIKLLMNYESVSRFFLFPELQFWNKLCLLESMDLSVMIVWCVIAGYGLTC